MKSKTVKIFSIAAFAITSAVICVLGVLPKDFFVSKKNQSVQTRIIEPELGSGVYEENNRMVWKESVKPLLELGDGEIQVYAISEDFDGDGSDEQIIAYRNLLENNNPIWITYIDYDENSKTYKRKWSAQTAATKQGTLSLTTMDLTGDHQNTIIVTGMNQNDEQTLSAFKMDHNIDSDSYKRIADFKIDGTISIQEAERSQAYQMGFANGVSFNITDRGLDANSANTLDQIENIYSYNPVSEVYERVGTTKIPGAQIEAKRLRELLSGNKNELEQFIDGLWYHISDEGTVDNEQYICFDTPNREVVFYNDDTQQIYTWQTSYATGYRIYISSQNISVPTLNRKITLELESLDSVRIKVSEDVRMRIVMNAPWDGSYRKASTLRGRGGTTQTVVPYVNAEFNSSIGRIILSPNGYFKIELNETSRTGQYAFFILDGKELLEFIPDNAPRETYKVERNKTSLSLIRVQLSTSGMIELSEPHISLNAIEQKADASE